MIRPPPEGFYRSPLQAAGWMRAVLGYAYSAYSEMARRWVAQQEIPRGIELLDIGCSTGELFASWAAPQYSNFIIGMDVEPTVLGAARARGFHPLVGEIESLAFADDVFDVICAFGVLSYMRDPPMALAALCDRLKPSGKLLAAAAVLGGLRTFSQPAFRALKPSPTFRYCPELERLKADLERAGFAITRVDGNPALWPLTRSPHVLSSRLRCALASWVFIVAERK